MGPYKLPGSFIQELINSALTTKQVDPDTRPSNIGPPFTGHFRITADTPRGLQAHQPAPGSQVTPGKPYAATERLANTPIPSKSDLTLDIRRNIYEPNGKEVASLDAKSKANGESAANGSSAEEVTKKIEEAVREPTKQYFCYSCGIDCTRIRYHYSKAAPHSATGKPAAMTKYDLCASCFLEARFPNTSSAVDWVNLKWDKIENDNYPGSFDKEVPWTDSELLLLLEGLELFDDDWNSVSDHIGSRTREECVLKFLQLEIEDKYLDPESTTDSSSVEPTAASMAYLSSGHVPFTQADNPVLSVMSFLAGLADPNVTAAAAGKSVDEVRRTMRERLEKVDNGSKEPYGESTTSGKDATANTAAPADGDKRANNITVKAEGGDAMDVDQSADGDPTNESTTGLAAATTAAPSSSSTTSSSNASPPQTSSNHQLPNTSTSKEVSLQSSAVTYPTKEKSQRENQPMTTIPLALTAARSVALASHQERHITRLVSQAVNLQLQKLELKLGQFSEMESMLAAERRDLERRRQQLFLDRLAFKKRVHQVEDELASKIAALNARESTNISGRKNVSGSGVGDGTPEDVMADADGAYGGLQMNGNAEGAAHFSSMAADVTTEEKLIAVPAMSNSKLTSSATALPTGTDAPGYTNFEI